MLEAGEMPPKEKPQPTAAEKKQLIEWVRGFLDSEARARSGDPGFVPMRRLSNAEYNYTIRDLTGIDLQPTREFPADGAAGEGFTNAAEALTDISPALLTKYLNAAKEIADHAVLLPDGFRFLPTKTRRDWTDESLAKLRKFYAPYGVEGRLSFQPYLLATVRHRAALTSKATTFDEVAAKERLNAKYLRVLWETLSDTAPSQPLEQIRTRWREATERDVPALAAEIAAWQAALWKVVAIGSYRYGDAPRQMPSDPAATTVQSLRFGAKPAPGQSDVVVYLTARAVTSDTKGGLVVWQRPRLEGAGQPPLLLRDYAAFGPAYEIDYPSVFASMRHYLEAAVEVANDRNLSVDDAARKWSLDSALSSAGSSC